MNKTWGADHETIEDRYRNPRDKFRLAFVCAKWLTGFDAQTVSTLYLDKPMQNHTLMQTIARANRVAPALDDKGDVATDESDTKHEKTSGLVVDYIGVFSRLEKALAKYARPQDDKKEYPAEEFEDLVKLLDKSIEKAIEFMTANELAISELIDSREVFKNLAQFNEFANKLSKTDELKKEFSVYQLAVTSFYEACKPDILTEELLPESEYRGKYKRIKEVFEYLRKVIDRKIEDTGNFDEAQRKADILIDESIISAGYTISSLQEISLSQIDVEKLETKFRKSVYQNLAITELVNFLQTRVAQLLGRNVTRTDLAERLQEIIAEYNTTSSDVTVFFKSLREYLAKLLDEEKRAAASGLSEEELEIFDLLFLDKLSEADQRKVKHAAQSLLQKLKDNETRRKIMPNDWYKNEQLRRIVDKFIADTLEENLPQAYDAETFKTKKNAVYTHVFNLAARGNRYWA
jgi:type I restriction enzyme R subunit